MRALRPTRLRGRGLAIAAALRLLHVADAYEELRNRRVQRGEEGVHLALRPRAGGGLGDAERNGLQSNDR